MKPSKHLHSYSTTSALALMAALSFTFQLSSAAAENATLLEGFENGIDSVTATSGRTTLSLKTSSAPDDPGVTQGKKSLEITVADTEGWAHDFDLTFSDANSDLLRKASQDTNALARYVLRFDFVFPGADVISWMDVQVDAWGLGDEVESNNATNTMSIALDLVTLPTDGQITMPFNLNFAATTPPFTTLVGYLDNIRLVDTYVPGA